MKSALRRLFRGGVLLVAAVAIVACQGAVGPAGADGTAGKDGAAGATGPQGPQGPQGEPGADAETRVLATPGTAYIAVDDVVVENAANTPGTPPEPIDIAMANYFIGGFGDITYARGATSTPATPAVFNLAVTDGMVVVTGVDGATLTDNTLYTTGDSFTVTATDSAGFVGTKTVVVFPNKAPVAATTVPTELTFLVGTQAGEATLNTTTVGIPDAAFTDDGHPAADANTVNAMLMYTAETMGANSDAVTASVDGNMLKVMGLPTRDAVSVDVKLTATDVGGLSDSLTATVQVDPAPWNKADINGGQVLVLKIPAPGVDGTGAVVIDVSTYFGDASFGETPEGLTYAVTKIDPDDDTTVGTGGINYIDAVAAATGTNAEDITFTPNAITDTDVMVTIRATEAGDAATSVPQWVEQTVMVQVTR